MFSLANLFVFVCEKERREDFPVVSVERSCYYSPNNGFGNISPNLKLAFTQEAEMKMRIILIIIIMEKKLHCTCVLCFI